MKSSRKTELIVGLFVLFSFLTLMTMSFVIKGGTGPGSYRIKMIYKDVSGLDIGSPVLVSGFRTGQVSKMDSIFNDEGDPRVVVTARVAQTIPIYKDAVARMNQQGFIGDKQLEIYPGTPEAGEVERDEFIDAEPFSALTQFLPGGQESFEDLQQILANIREITSNQERIENFDEAIVNVASATEELTAMVKENRRTLQETITNMEEVSRESMDIANRADRLIENADTRLNQFGDDFTLLVSEFRETNKQFQARLDTIGESAESVGSNADSFLVEGREELERLSNKLHETTENMNQLLVEMREGQGTVARLIRDPQPFTDLSDSMAALRNLILQQRDATYDRSIPYMINEPTPIEGNVGETTP